MDMREASKEMLITLESIQSDPDFAHLKGEHFGDGNLEDWRIALSHIGDGSKAEPAMTLQVTKNSLYGKQYAILRPDLSLEVGMYPLYTNPAPTAQDSKIADRIEAALKPRPVCRDCADENGRCPNSGELCDPAAKARELSDEVRKLAAQDSGKQFDPGTLGFLLEYIGQGDPEFIDGDEYEFLGETEEGLSGTYTHSITDLCRKAAEALRAQDSKVPEEWRLAMSQLVQAARTTGGTAGPDELLKHVCSQCEELLSATPVPDKPQWLDSKEKLPTVSDMDFEGAVFVTMLCADGKFAEPWRVHWSLVEPPYLWTPTGLQRPEAPEKP